jgi:phytoene synthase
VTSPATELDMAAAYDHCRTVTKREARNFYYAFVTLPVIRRRSIYAVYAFSRMADDIADGSDLAEAKARRLGELRSELRAALAGAPLGPVMMALADTAQAYDIHQRLFEEIIAGVEMDLTVRRYETFDDLKQYCEKVASAVGLISIQIFGYDDPAAKEYASDLGLAMQLTNILRDLKEDMAQDRVYLPQEDLRVFGYSEADLHAGKIDEHFAALMAFQAERTRAYFDSGAKLFPLLAPRSRGCAVGLHSLYSLLLARMERRGYDVFSERMSLPAWRKLLLTSWLLASSVIPWLRKS